MTTAAKVDPPPPQTNPQSKGPPSPQLQPSTAPTGGGHLVMWLVIFGLIIGGAFAWWMHHTKSASATETKSQAPRAAPVVVAVARSADMPIYLNGLGSVTALNTVTLHTRVDGQLDKVAFVEGQIVKAGDLLAEIDPRPFEVQLTQAQGQYAKDEALLKNARIDLERDKQAAEAIPQQQLSNQQALVDQTEAAIKIDQGQIDAAKLNLTYSRITAPITGRIGLRMVDVGNIVHASDANGMAVITQLQPIAVIFTLPQDDIPQLSKRLAEPAPLVVDAYDRSMTTKLATGKLLALDNQVNQTSGTVRIKAIFDNENNALFPNQFVNARLLVDTMHSAIIVPAAAIQRGPDSTFVYIVQEDQTVKVQTISVGHIEGDQAAIESGLSAGETVVTDGVDKLQDGSKVAPREQHSATRPSIGAENGLATHATTMQTSRARGRK